MATRLLVGLLLSALIGGLGYWRRSLTRSGWLGAIIVGTATTGLGSWAWGALIIVFFVLSSALSRLGAARKQAVAEDKFSKSDQRDIWQALANGGLPAALALGYALAPHPAWWAAALGALGTATADTWATEIGTLSRGRPRLITSGRPVDPGTSGAISGLGTLATTAGAATIGLAAWALAAAGLDAGAGAAWVVAAATLGGVGGSLIDSLLGATAQQMRWCPACGRETERAVHRCGTPTTFRRGWRWLDNDWVNLISTAGGASLGVLLWWLLA
jgi:uncharacterized protein (TIGR00297 family)